MPDLALAPASPALAPHMAKVHERRGMTRQPFWQNPLTVTILLAFCGALLLQLWRPCFFLTGDTLSAWLPPAVEAYRRLWEGRWPFYDPYLFGGVNLLQDFGTFTLLNPWALLFSFLARTPYYFLIPDIEGTGALVTIAGSFCWSALRLQRRFALPLRPVLLVALSLSYAFTPFNFLVGASWIGFLSAPAALPLILAGACERDWRKGLAIQTAGVAYALFGGHLHPFMVMGLFSTLFIVLLCALQRRWQPLFVWMAAGALPLLLSLPLLWPAMAGFQHMDRASKGLDVLTASRFNVPTVKLIASFLIGPASNAFFEGIRIDLADPLYNLSIAFALVNLPLVGVLCFKRRWTALEGSLLATLLVSALCVVRPAWLANIFMHLPLLHSLRWPFREIAVLNFFAHALFLLAFRPVEGRGPRRVALGSAAMGGAIYLMIFLCAAPTLWLFGPDRQQIMSGEADRFWNTLKAEHGPGAGQSRYVLASTWEVLMPKQDVIPFSLIGAFNYAALFRVHNVSGFSVTPPPSAEWLKRDADVEAFYWGGIFSPRAIERINKVHPDIQTIVLTGADPVVTWSFLDGQTVRNFLFDPKTHRVQFLPASP